MRQPNYTFKTCQSLADIAPALWDEWAGCDHPFLTHGFLNALEVSGCVGGRSGFVVVMMVIIIFGISMVMGDGDGDGVCDGGRCGSVDGDDDCDHGRDGGGDGEGEGEDNLMCRPFQSTVRQGRVRW